ncbi:MAG: hypothetical protein U9Q03_01575 [Patescibacteria group bacterium]|nr:hypothetical protein [Patescibacteria group bacterium]
MKGERNKRPRGRVRASFLLFVFLFFVSAPLLLLAPRSVQAQDTHPEIITDTQTTVTNIWGTLTDNLVEGAVTALVSGANYFLSKLAYEAAVALTSDCPGQVVCWDSKGFSEGLEDAWQGAVGEMVGTLSEVGGFEELGLNLCEPSTPEISMTIQLGILNEVEPPEPACDFNAIADNWTEFGETMTSKETLEAMMPAFEPGQGSLSVSLEVLGFSIEESTRASEEAAMKRLAESGKGGFSDILDPVSGRVLSPGSVVQKGFEKMETEKDEAPRESTQQMSAGQVARGAVLSVVINTVQTFVQTFLSRLVNKFTSGILTAEEAITAQPDIILSEEGLFRPPGESTAREALSRLLVSPPRDVGVIDPLLNFGVCPPQGRRPDNCVADGQLINAVRVAGATPFTVRMAIEEGYLHGDWPLISSNDAGRDQDPFCYTFAYCESNLKKLRAARVIPIGWEIAAHDAPIGSASWRLKDVVNGFEDCNLDGERDDDHPFCRLIDPDWVLKAPPTQCRAQVYGAHLLSPEIPQRQEQCVDMRTCLQQDDIGNCAGGWGYCVREKNVWRFNGDQCPEYYNSCKTLEPVKGGSPISYLMNTIDYGICNADNVGCQQYATTLNTVSCSMTDICDGVLNPDGCELSCNVSAGDSGMDCSPGAGETCRMANICANEFDRDGDGTADGCDVGCIVEPGQRSCSTLTGLESEKSDDWMELPARFFSDNVETCNAKDNGCSSLISFGLGQSLNMVDNGSFEMLSAGDAVGWLSSGVVVDDGESAIEGNKAIDLDGAGTTIYGPLPLRPNMMNTVSAAYMAAGGGNVDGDIRISFYNEAGGREGPDGFSAATVFSEYLSVYDVTAGGSEPCGLSGSDIYCNPNWDGGNHPEMRMGVSFLVTNPDVAMATIEFSGGNAYMDAVQFEEGPLTPYHTGYNAGRRVNLKLAPDYLGCTGEEGDMSECSSFALMCRETEVGCERYSPTNGDPPVPGIVGSQDYCPAECDGYDVFFQEETDFEAAAAEPDYFIPSTATECSSFDEGCTAFTNVETEAVEHYNHLRLCLHESDTNVETFYTWEGSDTTGYQLRAWSLQRTGDDSTPAGPHDVCDDAGCNTGYAPCVRLQDGNPDVCVDDPALPAHREGFCGLGDIDAGDFDCREFYDSAGNRHYRRLSKTIISSPDCRFYRLSGRTREDCEEKGNGVYDTALSECIYRASPSWSNACPAAFAGCRGYRGNAAMNVQTLFVEDFESESTDWRRGRHNDANLAPMSSESLVVGGQSVFVEGPGSNQHVWGYVDLQGETDSLYTLSFWARGSGQLDIFAGGLGYACLLDCPGGGADCPCTDSQGNTCDVSAGGDWCYSTSAASLSGGSVYFSDGNGATLAPAVNLTPEWHLYELGPVRIIVDNPGSAILSMHADAGADNVAYVDNIMMKRTRDNVYVIRDSWNTPDSCDRTMDGVYSPLEMLGCREYSDSQRDLHYLRSISALCRDGAVGCEAYSDTQNTSDTTGYRTYGAVCDLGGMCGIDVVPGGPNCQCDYTPPPVGAHILDTVEDACRVPIGESQCRFDLDGLDVSTEPPYCNEDSDCDTNICNVATNRCEGTFNYPDRFSIPADERIYVAADSSVHCPATSVGCRTMGVPEIQFERKCLMDDDDGDGKPDKCEDIDPDVIGETCTCWDHLSGDRCEVQEGETKCVVNLDEGVIGAWRAIAFRDDPSKYDQSLCETDAVGCEAFSGAGGTFYFKEPSNQVCKFKTNIKYEGVQTSGWFRKSELGGVFPCYDDLFVNGETFGIYKNGDEQYAGWVGLCEAEFDQCEEFVDPLDTSEIHPDGKPYYYLDNKKLDKAGCSGEASLKQGCVLVEQTSNTQSYFSSAASYFRSEFESGGGMVTPLDCSPDDPRRSGLCENRCYKKTNGSCEQTGTQCTQTSDCELSGCVPRHLCVVGSPLCCDVCIGDDTWGMGCREDWQCDQALGEVCEDPSTVPGVDEDEVTGNDSNLVLKVRRDRECAEWLECESVVPTYDSNAGRWINRCANFGLCSENMQVGESFVCSEFIQAPKTVLTADEYVARDTTWRGLDYSGFSLVGRYPSQYLQTFKVTRGVCRNSVGENEVDADDDPILCISSDDCSGAYTCTSPLSGVCIGDGRDAGRSCEVSNEEEIADDDDVERVTCSGDDYCSWSEFDTTRFGIRLSICAGEAGRQCGDDADCGGSGPCITSCTENSDCPSDGYGYALCDGGADAGQRCSIAADCEGGTCEPPGGTCLRGVCVYDFYGGPLNTASRLSAPSCRAYPEKDAPFPREVVDAEADMLEGAFTHGYDSFGNPAVKKTAFRGANVCHEGNSCECTYKRVSYGSGQSAVRFQSADGSIRYRDSDGDMVTGNYAQSICVGGPHNGRTCTPTTAAADCNEGDVTGVCTKVGSITSALGWPGFCVDSDESLRLYGEQDIPGCNLWLPVDIIPGMTDMFSQAPEAGFGAGFDDLTYCSLAVGNGDRGSCSAQPSRECTLGGIECEDDPAWGVCNPYNKILQADEGGVLGQPVDSEGDSWLRARDRNDCDGHLGSGSDDDWRNQLARDDISEIVVMLHDTSDPKLIILNENNGFMFANHFAGAIPDGDDEEFVVDGVKYLKNEADTSDTYNCINIFFSPSVDPECKFCSGETDSCGHPDVGQDRTTHGERNCIALMANFNSLGQYEGIDWRMCANKTGDCNVDHDIRVVGAHIRTRESCTLVSTVQSTGNHGVAWTDKLHNLANGQEISGFPQADAFVNHYVQATFVPALIDSGVDHTPFGRVALAPGLDIVNLTYPVSVVGAASDDEEGWTISGGSPFYSPAEIDDSAGTVDYPEVDPGTGYAAVAGLPLLCIGPCRVPENAIDDLVSDFGTVSVRNEAMVRLGDLFAVVYDTYSWEQTGGYTRESVYDNYDRRADNLPGYDSPHVRAVSTASCTGRGDVCQELFTEGISINGTTQDRCYPGGQAINVQLQYYAFADSEHMPIRRKIVDFGDGSPPIVQEGSFKNHRGLDTRGEEICGSGDGTDFGLTSDACDSRYYREQKTYTCSQALAKTLTGCTPGDPSYPCRDVAGCCVFKPRVQMLDNWGVCNGTCLGGPGGDLCFNGSPPPGYLDGGDPSSTEDECTVLTDTLRDYGDINDGISGIQRPWTEGPEITVCPESCN